MRLELRSKNVELDQALRDYAEAKFAHLTETLPEDVAVELELSVEAHGEHVAAATVFAKGQTLHASEGEKSLRSAIDKLAGNLERQVVRYREKRRIEPRRRGVHHE